MNRENLEIKNELKLQESLEKLKKIEEALVELGLNVRHDLITLDKLKSPTAPMGFPIVSDGAYGIRASYSSSSGLSIWYTNGFENPTHPKRVEVEAKLEKLGLK